MHRCCSRSQSGIAPYLREGCSKVMTELVPARFSGAFNYDFQVELYRGVFLPVRLHSNWSKRLILVRSTIGQP